MKLKEISVGTVYKHPLNIFNKYTWCIAEFYWSYLKKYDTNQIKKVVILVDDNPATKNNTIDESNTDVLVLMKWLDIDYFLSLNKNNQKIKLIKLLHESICFFLQKIIIGRLLP